MINVIFFPDGKSKTDYPSKLYKQIANQENINIKYLKLTIFSIIKIYIKILIHIFKKNNLIINTHHFKGALSIYIIKILFNLKKYKHIKWIHTFHAENWRFRGLKRLLNYIVFKRCDYFIGNSEQVSRQWMNFLNKKNITTINNGISNKEYSIIKNYNKTRNEVIKILWLGRLEKIKNPLLIIEALDNIKSKHKRIDLRIIGNGRLLKKVKNEIQIFSAKKENKNISINLYPNMGRRKVLENIGNTQIYINTSFSESFCNAAMESLVNNSCYLILPNLNTLKVIYDFKNILFYKKDSAKECAKTLDNLIKKTNLNKIYKINRSFPAKFKLENAAKNYAKIYKKVLSGYEF